MRQATGLSFLVELYPVFQNAWQYFQDFFFSSIYFKTLKKYTSPNRFGIETMSWSSSVSLNQVTFNPLSCILMSQPLANSTVKKLERKKKKRRRRERENCLFTVFSAVGSEGRRWIFLSCSFVSTQDSKETEESVMVSSIAVFLLSLR